MKQVLLLKPKTHKGKNRIREHGELWAVARQTDEAFLVTPFPDLDRFDAYMRWVSKRGDEHFDWRWADIPA